MLHERDELRSVGIRPGLRARTRALILPLRRAGTAGSATRIPGPDVRRGDGRLWENLCRMRSMTAYYLSDALRGGDFV
jgi:hypothetical protein